MSETKITDLLKAADALERLHDAYRDDLEHSFSAEINHLIEFLRAEAAKQTAEGVDLNLDNPPGHIRRDLHEIRLHIGILGRNVAPAPKPP